MKPIVVKHFDIIKNRKARELGITIITEDEFMKNHLKLIIKK